MAARLQKNVRLAAGALALANARLHVFLQPAIATTGKPLSTREKKMLSRFGSFMSAGYNQDAYRHIAKLLGTGGLPANASFTDLSGLFDAIPETPGGLPGLLPLRRPRELHDRAGMVDAIR